MNAVPTCLLTEYAQPITETEEARVQAHSAQFRAVHREWSAKIRGCKEVGILSVKANLMYGMDWGSEVAYADGDSDNLALFRAWGMTLNDICAIEETLATIDARRAYLALATERRLDSGLSHFTLFTVDHNTGDQALVFHRSDCMVEGFFAGASTGFRRESLR